MASERQLIVRVIGDDKSLTRALARDQKAIATFGNTSAAGLGKVDAAFAKTQRIAAGGFVGGAALTAGLAALKTSTDAASDLNEQVSKSDQVFGDSAKAIQAWSKTTAKSLGISQTAALDATGTFGNLFTAIGIGGPEAAATSQRLVQLAADLASFNNADPSQVLEALRSGLIGEAEPLRRFGVLLSEARVQQVALAQTGKDNIKSLSDQEKALARVTIIFRDTAKAQGDFARTSDELANQERILAAETADLTANIGSLLLPAVQRVTQSLTDAASVANDLTSALIALGNVSVPPIKIPFVGVEVPGTGGTLGSILGDVADVAKFTPLNPLFGATIAKNIADQFRDQTSGDAARTTDLANQFQENLGSFFSNALTQAENNVKPPKAVKGFGSGLTPEDLFGPLIKGVTDAQKEALLDAQRLTPVDVSDDLVELLDIRASLTKALEDPRLKRAGRLEIKQALASVQAQIDAANAELTGGIDEANRKRQDRIEKAQAAAAEAQRKQREGFNNLFDRLRLEFDRAQLTAAFSDDLAKVRALQKAVQAQIKVEGSTPDLLRRLFDLRDEEADILSQQTQQRQFRRLGLAITGEDIVPQADNLRKQFSQLSDRLRGTGQEIGSKLTKQFELAGKLLKDPTEKLTEQTREAIRNLFDTVRDAFKDEVDQGPLTKTTALSPGKILDGLGLGRDLEKELRARLSSFNSAGLAISPAAAATRGTGVGVQPIVANITVVSELDGQRVGLNTKRFLLNDRRFNPPQRRGPNAG